MVFYDEETEDEEEEEAEGEGQTMEAPTLPLGVQTDERPESVLTDVTVDGLAETEIPDLPGKLAFSVIEKRFKFHEFKFRTSIKLMISAP